MSEPLIVFENVHKSFTPKGAPLADQTVEALRDVSFHVNEGEFVSLLGPSGCGKTTCLRILAGLTSPSSGKVLVAEEEVAGPSPERAVVFQGFNLLPWKTVLANAEFGLKLQGVPVDERRDRARRYLALVGLEGFEEHYPHQLSGGMQQRLGIARALATEASILLMDEPFASVDAQTRELLQEELLKALVRDDRKRTVLFITHSLDEAVYLSDRVLVLRARPGTVNAEVSIDLPRPRWEHQVHADPRFGVLRERLWGELRGQGEGEKREVAAG